MNVGAMLVGISGKGVRGTFRKKRLAEQIVERTAAFERRSTSASARMLFLGDSTARGVGADTPEETVAGYFAADFPNADIANQSKDGTTVSVLADRFVTSRQKGFDLTVLHLGANDVIRFRMASAKSLGENLTKVIDRLRAYPEMRFRRQVGT